MVFCRQNIQIKEEVCHLFIIFMFFRIVRRRSEGSGTNMRYVLHIISAALLMLSGAVSSAETARFDYVFEHYSTDDGLPHNSIAEIHQDARGYIWVCTWYGLSRFDGNTFVNYIMLPGDFTNLTHNRMLSLDEDVNGYLWLRTYDYRMYRFDPATEKFVAIPDELPDFSGANLKVTCFHSDRKGNAWIVVPGVGFYRISPDLEVSRIPSGDPNAVGTDVRHIYESSDGTIYIVSELGLAAVEDGIPTLLSRVSDVVSFCEFGNRLYFAGAEEIVVIDRTSGILPEISVSPEETGPLTSMTVTGEGDSRELYLGFRNGAVACLDTLSMQYSPRKYDMGRVRYLFPDSGGLLWIATDRTGIFSYNPDKDRFRRYEHPRNVMSYYADTLARVLEHDGTTWIKMNDYGFGWYDRENDRIVPLNNVKTRPDCRFMNGVACFEVDRSGVLWMSTAQRGLERVTVISPKVEVIDPPTRSEDNLAASEVRAILRDSKDNVWVATKSRELYLYSPDMQTCRPVRGNFGVIYTIFEDRDGYIWLGTKGDGLVRMGPDADPGTVRRYRHNPASNSSLSSDDVYSIEQDGEGKIWVGTFGGGLSMLRNPDTDEFLNMYNSFPGYPVEYGDRVRYLHCMRDGRMLVATVGGLLWFDPAENPETTVFHSTRKIPGDIHSIGNNDIIYIFSDNGGENTYLCTFGGGLNRIYFDQEDNARFDIISTAQGLSSNIVLSGAVDAASDIWIATERGLSRIDHGKGTVVNYTRYDGIIPTTFSEATCAVLPDGTLLFGTLNDVYRIDPGSFGRARENSRLVISGVTVNDRRVPMSGETIDIPHDYSFFRIDFASLNFRVRGQMKFSYRLEGYDKDWITDVSNRSVTYSRIPPGKYTFVVSVTPYEGTSSAETASIDLRVRPSVWNSVPARISYVLAALLLAVILLRMFMTSVRLRNGIRMEQDLNDVKVRFFTNISHELRTPLTLILGGIDEVSRNTPKGDRNEYSVNMVYKNAKRMMTLVNQLLDIRKIVSGKIRLRVSQIDIVDLLRRVYDDFKDMSAERQIELRLTHSVDSLMIWGDEMRLEALIYNLLSNAFKYTADGGRIEAAVYYREGEQEFTIMVKDNGIGVPKEKQKTIFEPFIQASHEAFKGMSSSGIGLSFCKQIADMHGGRIWVESEKDSGSEFYVRLPIDRDHFSNETAEFIELNSETLEPESYGLSKYRVSPTYPAGAVKVLIVEDNAELRVYMYNNLVNRFEVKDAANGKEALNLMSDSWMPDVIVTDLMMPEMNGIELINHIRNDFNTSHIPIIMFTAKHESDTHLKAMRYGADGYMTKPFTMELLVARIDNLLDSRRRIIANMASESHDAGGERKPKVSLAPAEVVITDKDKELISKVREWLEENVSDSEITVDRLAAYVGMGRTSMYNKIKGLTGKSPVELIQEFRLEKATYYLKSGQYSVSETSYKVGFSDPGYFSRSFKKHFGLSPADYMKEHRADQSS